MKEIKSAVNPFKEALKFLPADILCGISGGVDSIVLLHSLVESGKRPVVLHFKHGWRKEEEYDAKLVEETAKELGVEFITGKSKKSLPQSEAIAREDRFRFFKTVAEQKNCFNLVLAHHADDQVETFLMQLIRGTGSRGWGMDKQTSFGKLIIYRPFLEFWKSDIISFAQKRNYRWVEDQTNDNALFLRNRIRKELIPFLENRFSRSIKKSLWKFCEVLREEKKWMTSLVQDLSSSHTLRLADLESAPIGKKRLILALWLKKRGISDISFDDIESIRKLIEEQGKKKCNLSRKAAVILTKGELLLTTQ
ncbi:tRNA lysidine(34) synthetase TilS [Methylacidiphilum caldifontis]|uniref:tRNA(Ile)-lysidine synthase n=1 Tax=Methylacidiphilum caldifontis TaxID=2795386 RepID=A0A4Y8PDD7_9BACT|nr:tRNA lysidine(34) synthetase TilS [Methylacidiphilum caldifontis]QSR87998.1 tRNA lysidine(34) synthetase TilS [Methylacidiphilum caldifontis]TFE69537.1 tRNA lysidine(34) synthetase TilS [Methylacidiphilum caldifontis]